jgi:hypothetical protein
LLNLARHLLQQVTIDFSFSITSNMKREWMRTYQKFFEFERQVVGTVWDVQVANNEN